MGTVRLASDGTYRRFPAHPLSGRGQARMCRPISSTACRNTSAPRATRPNSTGCPAANGSARRAKVKQSIQEIAGDLLKLYAQREANPGHAFEPGYPVAARIRGQLPLRGDAGPACGDRGHQARYGKAQSRDGPAAVRRRRLWQNRGCAARHFQGGHGWQTGGDARTDDDPRSAALQYHEGAIR